MPFVLVYEEAELLGQAHQLSDPEGFWSLNFKDLLDRIDHDRHIEVIIDRSMEINRPLVRF